MAWPKGKTKEKTGGRVRGTPNKRTSHLEEILASLDTCVPEKIVQLLPELSPEKRVDVLLDLMSYLYPKRKAVEHSVDQEAKSEPIVVHFVKAKDGKAVSDPGGEEYMIHGPRSEVADMEDQILANSSLSDN